MSEQTAENSDATINNQSQIVSNNMQSDDADKSSFPDGFGMSIEDIRNLLIKKHETLVPKDDPILLTVTILNVFLEQQEKLNKKQLSAINEVITKRTELYIKGVKDTTEGLSKTLENITVEGIRDVQEKYVSHLYNFKNSMWWATAIITISAVLNVCTFILR